MWRNSWTGSSGWSQLIFLFWFWKREGHLNDPPWMSSTQAVRYKKPLYGFMSLDFLVASEQNCVNYGKLGFPEICELLGGRHPFESSDTHHKCIDRELRTSIIQVLHRFQLQGWLVYNTLLYNSRSEGVLFQLGNKSLSLECMGCWWYTVYLTFNICPLAWTIADRKSLGLGKSGRIYLFVFSHWICMARTLDPW